jgi:hypothetical protein
MINRRACTTKLESNEVQSVSHRRRLHPRLARKNPACRLVSRNRGERNPLWKAKAREGPIIVRSRVLSPLATGLDAVQDLAGEQTPSAPKLGE